MSRPKLPLHYCRENCEICAEWAKQVFQCNTIAKEKKVVFVLNGCEYSLTVKEAVYIKRIIENAIYECIGVEL